MGTEFKLRKPVQSEGQEIDKLTFREPIGDDVIACGYPISLVTNAEGGTEYRVNPAAIAKLAARMANVPPSTIKNLSVADFNDLTGVISGFFG